MHLENLVGDRAPQIELEVAAGLRHHVHAVLEEAPGAPSVGLGPVERHVGVLEQEIGVGAVARRQGDADAGADHHLVAADLEGLGKPGDDALGERSRLFRVTQGILQHDELVAAETGDDVGASHGRAQPVGHDAQELIAARVAQRVVDLLELVEVDEVDGEWPAAAQARHRGVHLVAEKRPVRQAGERIVAGQLIDLGLGHAPIGDVLEQNDRAPVGHGVKRQRQRAPLLGLDEHLAVACARKPALEFRQQAPRMRARQRSAANASVNQLERGCPLARNVGRRAEQLRQALVADRHAALGVEHAQARAACC